MYYNNYIIHCILLENESHVHYITSFPFHSIDLGLAVSIPYIGCVDLCSRPEGGNNLTQEKMLKYFLMGLLLYALYILYILFCRLMLS